MIVMFWLDNSCRVFIVSAVCQTCRKDQQCAACALGTRGFKTSASPKLQLTDNRVFKAQIIN
jgi:hypothetical protein